MSKCWEKNVSRPALKPRQGKYQTINALKIRPSFMQISTLLLVIMLIVLHSMFIIGPVRSIDSPILWVMFGIHFGLLLIIIISYIQIVTFDPVDRCIIDPAFLLQQRQNMNVNYCNICRSDVTIRSYHCKRCNRCTEEFDHHCIYLNSCVGGRNYELFMRILLLFIVFNVNLLGQSIWVFIQISFKGENQLSAVSRWGCLPIIIISVILLILALILCGFHLQISCCLQIRTIDMVESKDQINYEVRMTEENVLPTMAKF